MRPTKSRLVGYGLPSAAGIVASIMVWILSQPAEVTVSIVLLLDQSRHADQVVATVEALSVVSRTYGLSVDGEARSITFRGFVDERRLHDLRFSLAAIKGVQSASITTRGRSPTSTLPGD